MLFHSFPSLTMYMALFLFGKGNARSYGLASNIHNVHDQAIPFQQGQHIYLARLTWAPEIPFPLERERELLDFNRINLCLPRLLEWVNAKFLWLGYNIECHLRLTEVASILSILVHISHICHLSLVPSCHPTFSPVRWWCIMWWTLWA